MKPPNFFRQYPQTRLRRMRKHPFSRHWSQEAVLLPCHLICPVFVKEGLAGVEPIESMPDVNRFGLDELLRECEALLALGIEVIAIFPVVDSAARSLQAESAYDPEGLVPQVVKTVKSHFPEMGVITDIALDPYTSHGQDGIVDAQGYVLNDETVEVLVQQALVHAAAGADIVAPSDMMDGRIGVIRNALEAHGYADVMILSYAAKYASAFYGPFREAIGSGARLKGADKCSYQMNPANVQEALHEVSMDLAEGADMVMVKPGMPYLDVVTQVKQSFQVPTVVYQVSGEYAMLQAAFQQGYLQEDQALHESLLSFRRAGADAIITYFAKKAARLLHS